MPIASGTGEKGDFTCVKNTYQEHFASTSSAPSIRFWMDSMEKLTLKRNRYTVRPVPPGVFSIG
jgi:Na+/serine symporter